MCILHPKTDSSFYTVLRMYCCEYCGHELERDKTKYWEERHKCSEKVEFQDTIRRFYYSMNKDSDKVCIKCYRKLMIKKILIRLLSWCFALFFIIGVSFSQGNPLMTGLTMASFFFGFFTLIINRSFLYSVVGFVLSPFLGPCEMHPFGNEYTIRERREDKVPISIECKIEKVKKYLMKKYHLSENDVYISLYNLEREMGENYEKYKRMKTKDLTKIVLSQKDEG